MVLHQRAPQPPRQAIEGAAQTARVIETSTPVETEAPAKTLPSISAKVTSPLVPSRESPKKLPSEATIIDQAHRQLQADPERALALTETHRKLYPQGILAQEREVIAIEALSRLGKGRAAEKRVDDFRTKQPHSVHDLRLRNVTKDAGRGATP
jgi:hypothetical protein